MAKVVSAVEQELLEATGVKRKTAEKPQKYLGRLIDAVQELPDEDWEKLSSDTQNWVNAGAKAIKAEEDIDDFPADEPAEEEEAAAEEENTRSSREKPASKTRGGGKTTEKETTSRRSRQSDGEEGDADKSERRSSKRESTGGDKGDKGGKEKAAKSERKPVGAQTMIKQLMIDNPKITTDELMEKLQKKGYTPTPLAVSSIRSGFRHSLKVIKEAGLLPKLEL
jgi:hypothetical protein